MQEDERQLSGAMLREEAIFVAPPPGPLHVARDCLLGICTFAWLAVPGDTEASGASAWTLIEGFVVPMSPNDELGWITLYTEDRDWLISAVFNTNQTHGSPQDDDGSPPERWYNMLLTYPTKEAAPRRRGHQWCCM
jgi:hypothetical protein